MAAANKQKYIAEGFLEDSSSLLIDFVNLDTVEFSNFATLWRNHHFSLIFMGRPDHTETSEFVNEIFRITSNYLFSPSFYQQVGAVYILYALFRTQISEPPVLIRIQMNHWEVIKTLRNEAISKDYKTLHYVIDFLIDNAFLYVANQTLKGPLMGNMPKTSKHDQSMCNMKATYKSDIMKYSASNKLATLRDLQIQYIAEKKNIEGSLSINNLSTSYEVYDEAIQDLDDIVNPRNKTRDDLGVRRVKLKNQSFMRKSKNRFGIVPDDEVEIEDEFESKHEIPPSPPSPGRTLRQRKPRRPPKAERKVGRPRIKPKKEPKEPPPETEPKSDDEIDISHLLQQQKNFYLPPLNYENRKLRTKRDAYYQVSPKQSESDSDISE